MTENIKNDRIALRTVNRIIALENLLYGEPTPYTMSIRSEYLRNPSFNMDDLFDHEKVTMTTFMDTFIRLKFECKKFQYDIQELIKTHGAILPDTLKEVTYTNIDECVEIYKELDYLHDIYVAIDVYLIQFTAQAAYKVTLDKSINQTVDNIVSFKKP